MDLYLDNVGKICDSTIIVDGLTVITGENNSGKTTVGKTLYSIVSAVENLEHSAFIDKRDFARKSVRLALSRIKLYRYSKSMYSETDKKENITDIDVIFDLSIFERIENIEGLLYVIDEKIKKIENCSEKYIYEFLKKEEIPIKNQISRRMLVDNFTKEQTKFVELLKEIKESINTDFELIRYANAKIVKTLKAEFYNQIKGVYSESKKSRITLSHKKEKYYNIELLDNELSNKDRTFFMQAFDTALFIDDVFVVDDMAYRQPTNNFFIPNEYEISYESLLNRLPRKLHNEKLLDKLQKDNNLFEETLYKAKTEKIIKCLKDANPGQISIIKGNYVIEELDIRNLAMGSKMILIIKTLIEKGHCNSRTLLVLDEPEIHLHPEWQNILAETIVLLVKHFETKIILTTHSPNFLLAVDVFSKKHKIRKITHFYKSTVNGEKAKLEISDNNINDIYAKMTEPFIKLEAELDESNN